MTIRVTLLVLSAVLTHLVAPRSTCASTIPADAAVDVHHLALDLRFDWPTRRTHGIATLTLAPLRDTTRIALDARRLAVQSVALASGATLTFSSEGGVDRDQRLFVVLDRRYARGEVLSVTVTYYTTWHNTSDPNNLAGSTGRGIRFFAPTTTEPVKRRQVWSMGEPQGSPFWFPGNDDPADVRTTEIAGTVPAPLTFLSNGQLLETRDNSDGTRTFRWRADTPHPNYLTSFVVGEYVDIAAEAEGVRLHSFGYPDEAAAVAASVVRLPDMVRYFSQVTGQPYRLGSYGQAFVQDLPWGTGSFGLSTLTENMVDDERTHADYLYLWDGLEAEALAQQWFGSYLTIRDWRHAWLTKGFAHYFDALYDEHVNGRANMLLWKMSADLTAVLADWKAGLREPVVPMDLAVGAERATGNAPYARGALVLHMLRRELGDDVWWTAIRRYVRANGGRAVTTVDFERVVETAAGRPMRWFFDQWVYGAGHPIFVVTTHHDQAHRALIVTVRQTQAADAKATPGRRYFQGHVDLAIDGRVERVWLAPRRENRFTFPVVERPRLVTFDHEGTWLKELTFEKSLPELLVQLNDATDVVARRTAIDTLTGKAKDTATSSSDRAAILDALRALVISDAYWRLRYVAILQLQAVLAPSAPDHTTPLDAATTQVLVDVIRRDGAWVKAAAVGLLGTSRDRRWVDLYIQALEDSSHPVNYAAAIALGQTADPRVFEVLTAYVRRPSWKGENMLCGLAGLKELGDPRGAQLAFDALAETTSHRWTLAVARWDFRIAAAEALARLRRTAEAFDLVRGRLDRALAEDDVNDIFSNALLVATLGDSRGVELFTRLKAHFQGDTEAMSAVAAYEKQFIEGRNSHH